MSPTIKKESDPRLATLLIHSDQELRGNSDEVVPSISVTTTYRSKPFKAGDSKDFDAREPERHVYSRYTQQISTRAEHVLSKLTNGYAITYASGLSAAYAALVFFHPKRIGITGGYHGCHSTIAVYQKTRPEVEVIDIDAEYQPGDLCWLETPLNPTGESRDIQHYANKVHAVGGKLLVDSTFGPPPLQDPFKWGADCILHSGTKYFGGHSDLLCGVLVVGSEDDWKELHANRTFMGHMMGSLESWLLLRSLRTVQLRVLQQSKTAAALAQWLSVVAATPEGQSYDGVAGGIVKNVFHSSLQPRTKEFDPSKQMEGGWSPTFAITLTTPEMAAALPFAMKYFIPATSLGGVESLIEYRLRADATSDPRLLRLSVGVEDLEDLKADFRQALKKVRSKVSSKL